MAYTTFDYAKPDPTVDNGTAAFDNTRQNLLALRDAVMTGTMPGWTMTPSGGTAAEPTQILYSKGVERVKLALTWTTNKVTQVIVSYSSDSGGVYDTIGTETITYDASSNVTGITWS